MKTRMRIAAIVLAGCMVMGNLQLVSAQENSDLTDEIAVSAEQEELTVEAVPDTEQVAETYMEIPGAADEAIPVYIDEYSGEEEQSGFEEEALEEIIVQEDAGTENGSEAETEAGSIEETAEEELELIPTEDETEQAAFVFGQEYTGNLSEEEPLQKYVFTLDHESSVQITAKTPVPGVQYSIAGQDEVVCWNIVPEWNPETESSEITETVALAEGTYTFTVGLTEAYAGEYTFRIDAISAEPEQAADLPEAEEDTPLIEENAEELTEEVSETEEVAPETAEEAAEAEDAAADPAEEAADAEEAGTEEAAVAEDNTAAEEEAEQTKENVDAKELEKDEEAEEDEEVVDAFPDATLLQGGTSKANATTIKFGTAYTGTISSSQKEHWYKLTLPTECNVDLYALAAIDCVWYNVYSANTGSLKWYKSYSRSSSEYYSTCEESFEAQGTFYFVVEQYSSYTGNFMFMFDVPVSGVKLNKTSLTVAPGKTATLKATVSPSVASNKNVTWKSSNTSVATVNSKGVVTGKKKGTATITVTTKDGNKKATCKVTVGARVTGVKLNKTKLTLKLRKTATLKATVSPSNAVNKKVTWKSSNTAVATVSSKGVVTAKKAGTAKITATTVDGKKVATCTVTVKGPSVNYRTHVQTYGWQGWKKDGAMSGTEGQRKRLEGINIKLSNAPYSGGITYRTHVQTYGWQGWRSNGAMSGTSGQAKRLEGIQIKLTGEMAKHYDVYYRVHAQRLGWMAWAKNGAQAGTAGYAFRLEGIQIVLVTKGGSAPSNSLKGYARNSDMSFTDAKVNKASITLSENYSTTQGPDIVAAKCSYSGSTLVVDATIYNTQSKWAYKYTWLTIYVYDKNGSQFASKTFYNVPLNMSGYSTKHMTFRLEDMPIKNINSGKGGGIYLGTTFSVTLRRY